MKDHQALLSQQVHKLEKELAEANKNLQASVDQISNLETQINEQGDAEQKLKTALEYISGLEKENKNLKQRKAADAGLIAQLKEENRSLERLSFTDKLTGIPNRRAFDMGIDNEVNKAKRRNKKTSNRAKLSNGRRKPESLSVVMIDIDFFKPYNDNYGHQKGDVALRRVAMELKSALKRPGDFVARYGGEEFIFILPDTDIAGAQMVAEEARRMVKAIAIPHEFSELKSKVVTLSCGISTITPQDQGISAKELVKKADQNLYKAKECGRNRVCCD